MGEAAVVEQNAIVHPVKHVVKFEACLCWPDGATRSPFKHISRVRLYKKADLESLVTTCRDEGRPVTWRDVEESGKKHIAQNSSDRDSGYFFFAEEEDVGWGEAIKRWARNYKKVDEWPEAAGTRFYLAVEGCAIVLPLRSATLVGGNPKRDANNAFADKYFLDAADYGCLLELEVYEREVDGVPTLQWKMEAAFAKANGHIMAKNGSDYFRDVVDFEWTYLKKAIWPGEKVERKQGIPTIQVVPLCAYDAREDSKRRIDLRWAKHPEVRFEITNSIKAMFNLPDVKPRLRFGLNVDGNGYPKRKEMLPKAFLDFSTLEKRTSALDSVIVRFFAGILRGSGATGTSITLRSFIYNGADEPQVPFGDAFCMTEDFKSCIRVFNAAGFDIISPIQPQYTQNVQDEEQLYDPLRHVSGGRLVNGVLVDYILGRNAAWHRRGGRKNSNMQDAYDWVPHYSWAPDLAAVRRSFYYHDDYFKVGGTGGIFTSSRGTAPNIHDHVGLDLYNYCMGGFDVSTQTLQGEAMYAMFRGRLMRRTTASGTSFNLCTKVGNEWRHVDMMHSFQTSAPGMAHLTTADQFQMVWAGTFIGWSGSSGNAEGPNVSSKHLHMYYMTTTQAALPGTGSGPKVDPANLFQAGTGVGAAGNKRNHYPFVRGRIVNSHDEAFKAEHVKVIAYDRSDGLVSPLTTTDMKRTRLLAITTCNLKFNNNNGYFEMHIPADVPVGLVVTRAFCAPAAIGDDSDCTDQTRQIGPYTADVRYGDADGYQDLGTIKIEFKQSINGRTVGNNDQAKTDVNIEVVDVASATTVCKLKSGADGKFSARVPAGKVKVKFGPAGATVKEIAARAIGTDHDMGDVKV